MSVIYLKNAICILFISAPSITQSLQTTCSGQLHVVIPGKLLVFWSLAFFLWTLKSALSCPQQRNNSILLRSTVLHSTTSYSTVTFGDVISQKSAWFKYRFRQLAFGNGVNNMVAPSNIDGAGLAQSA